MTTSHFDESDSVASPIGTISAYVDYTPRRKLMTTRPEPFDDDVTIMSRQRRSEYFHQLAQQTDNDGDDYMNSPAVRRYHGFEARTEEKPKEAKDPQTTKKEWCLDDFDVGECLGTGRLGTVYSATELRTGKVVALKTVIKQEILDANVFRFLKREIEIQCRLWHPHILHLYAYFHDPKHVYIVLENAPGGSLHDLLRKSGAIAETTVAKYMTQMVDAVRFIHSLGVLHRDIKPENVLIGADGQLKLADFGWAVHDHRPRRRTFCGTLDYLAPEMIENKPHDKKVDIWALGVLCYELLVGSPPFEEPEPDSINKTYNRIIQLKYTFPSHIGMNAQHFVTRILQHDPPKRPQLDELERHPWLQAARNDQ